MKAARYSSRSGTRLYANGFTLIEVVIALSILSMVMLATVTGFRTLANTQVTLERMTARVDEMRAVSSFLRDSIESAAVGTSSAGGLTLGGNNRDEAYFEIQPNALIWKSTIMIGEAFGGSYFLRLAKEGDVLTLRWQEPDSSGEPQNWGQAPMRALADGVQVFDLSWRGDYRQPWQQDWRRGDAAAWVRVELKTGNRFWPELIMQVPQ
ncbi:MAG: prepilin-type N-terminal cleavage/methylation domain-containing protein [Pseudomonadota bacterium]